MAELILLGSGFSILGGLLIVFACAWVSDLSRSGTVCGLRSGAAVGKDAELVPLWVGTRAADEGADWLPVDVWTTNEHLQHYYLRQGFTYVHTVVLPHNPSGALFQRPAEHAPTPHLQEVESLPG